MGYAMYFGANNTSHRVKRMYIGVDGKSRRVVKGYIGVDGKSRLFYYDSSGSSSGGGGGSTPSLPSTPTVSTVTWYSNGTASNGFNATNTTYEYYYYGSGSDFGHTYNSSVSAPHSLVSGKAMVITPYAYDVTDCEVDLYFKTAMNMTNVQSITVEYIISTYSQADASKFEIGFTSRTSSGDTRDEYLLSKISATTKLNQVLSATLDCSGISGNAYLRLSCGSRSETKYIITKITAKVLS